MSAAILASAGAVRFAPPYSPVRGASLPHLVETHAGADAVLPHCPPTRRAALPRAATAGENASMPRFAVSPVAPLRVARQRPCAVAGITPLLLQSDRSGTCKRTN